MIEKQDLLVLGKLRANSRATLTDIGAELKIPVTTVFEKVRKLKRKVITKYVDILAFEKIGFVVRANFILKVEEKKREQLRKFLLEHKNVNSLFRTNSGFDFFVETIFADMSQLQQFSDQLDALKATKKMHFVVEEIKREGFCPE